MAKNMFDESGSKRVNIFDSFKNKNKISSSDTESNFKNSKKSNCSNSFRDNNRDPVLKEVRETGSIKSKAMTPNNATPAMYRIALKLKRLTEVKLKKSSSETVVVTNRTELDEKNIIENDEKSIVQNNIIKEETSNFDNDIKFKPSAGISKFFIFHLIKNF